jgi:hypothetical protein
MSDAAPGRFRTWWPIAALAVAVLLVAGLGGAPDEGLPLDPDSTAPLGTRALISTLEGLGAQVSVSADPPDAGVDVALLLTDVLDREQRSAVESWVDGGGTLVVSDPLSELSPQPAGGTRELLEQLPLRRQCDEPALAGANQVALGFASVVLSVPEGAVGCFPSGDGHWLVIQPRAAGAVVSLGGPEVFTNGRLGMGDNAVLAANLLTPERGTRVRVLRPPRPGEGSATLADLVSPRLRTAAWQLAVAFLLFALWRAWRLGRPITEPQPVQIAGSELVVAVGSLLQQAEARGRAATLLRDDLVRTVAERLGLPASLPADELAQAVEQRTGVARDRVLAVLLAPAPADDAELLRRTQDAEHVRTQILTPTTTSTGGQQ